MMRTLLDTNILLRLSDPIHDHHPHALAAVERLKDDGHDLFVVPQNLYEYWVVATRGKPDNGLGFSPELAQHDIDQILRYFTLLRDERTILDLWRRVIVDHNVSGRPAHDARLVAAMQRHGLGQILTFDARDFKRYPGIAVLSPKDVSMN